MAAAQPNAPLRSVHGHSAELAVSPHARLFVFVFLYFIVILLSSFGDTEMYGFGMVGQSS